MFIPLLVAFVLALLAYCYWVYRYKWNPLLYVAKVVVAASTSDIDQTVNDEIDELAPFPILARAKSEGSPRNGDHERDEEL